MSGRRFFYPILFSFIFLLTSPVFAQFGGLNAEFAGAGARAMAMGGAFIGLADDAMASEYNPAGLRQLRRAELGAQVVYTFDERLEGRLDRDSLDNRVDILQGRDQFFVPPFASFVYPNQYLTVGLTRFTNIYYDRNFDHPISGSPVNEKVSNDAYGLTLATSLFPRFHVGTTIRFNQFHFESDSNDPVLGHAEFEDEAWTANVGALWRLHRFFQVGAVYKSTQSLEGTYRGSEVDTRLPDTFGVGVAFLPDDRWRVLLDADRIWWSEFETDPTGNFVREDVWRVHAGAEYYAGSWKQTAFFLRAGYMFEEPNAIVYRGDNQIFKELTSEGDNIHHFSFGFGIARPQYQIDVGLDITEDHGTDVIASMVWYF
jgi:long-subunit fatty acid transport protein